MPRNNDSIRVGELEARLAEALEQQAATSEILRVISRSQNDVQPVFDTIVAAAMKLCRASSANFFTFDGELIHLAALVNATPEGAEAIRRLWPKPPGRSMAATRAIMTCSSVLIPDVLADRDFAASASAIAGYFRSILAVPLVREGRPIGAIAVGRPEAGPFPDAQVALLQTFADQAVIAIENVRLFNETKEALEQQTATNDILRVISQSPTDAQPVFETIAAAAQKLCHASLANVFTFDGDLIHLAAVSNVSVNPEHAAAIRQAFPRPPDSGTAAGRAILAGNIVDIPDVIEDRDYAIGAQTRLGGIRSLLAVPLIRSSSPIGAITVARPDAGRFPDKQIALLQTFAEQAVIAIENARLFNETKEALERQTATGEVLRVISGSPTDVQPVFDVIAQSAARLCDAEFCHVFRFDGALLHLGAIHGLSPEGAVAIRRAYPMAPGRGSAAARSIVSGAVEHVPDVHADPDYAHGAFAKIMTFRSIVAVPMLRDGVPIGSIAVARPQTGFFPERQIQLLQSFADQAVIAIENVRLFNETKDALERQTATSEVLQVISSSPTGVQPVFDIIAERAARLCDARYGLVFTFDGEWIHLGSVFGMDPKGVDALRRRCPLHPGSHTVAGRIVSEGVVVHVPDVFADPEYVLKETAELAAFRGCLGVPMLREGQIIGAITVTRADVGRFTDKQVELLQTFASQAVIAIENVRLFKVLDARTEALTRSVGQLTALGEVGQAVSSTLDLEIVLNTIVSRAVEITGLDGGSIYEYDERAEEFRLQAAENMPQDVTESIRSAPTRKGDGALGRTAITLEPTQVPDTLDDSYQSVRKELLLRAGYRALLAVPLLCEGRLLGGLLVNRKTPGPFAPEIVELLKTFGTQSALAIQNARLFREIAEKGRQLEAASRHKSDFLASMSHELRTPLNAILGFNEMILGEIYGDVPAAMKEPLEDIQTSGKHLLRLINNVLDLAKIEAGRMELSLADYSVQDTVESVRATLRPLAADKGLDFVATVPAEIPLAYGDSGRITQCLMNLAGNSLKFTKAGKVEIAVESNGDLLVYKVADTGIGIPPDKLDSVFLEFKQTDATIAREYGGTGLGLSISRKFVEMHGGRIWVESELGKGSTFLFEIPLRVGAGAQA